MNEEHRRGRELRLVLARMNAVDRADVNAGSVLGTDTRVGNHERHNGSLAPSAPAGLAVDCLGRVLGRLSRMALMRPPTNASFRRPYVTHRVFVLTIVAFLAMIPTDALAQVATAPTPPSDAVIGERVDEYMRAEMRAHGFSGTILLSRKGKPIVSRGYGAANAEWNIPNTPRTKFRLGSITKQFTSMAVLQLQEQGKLKVQDPICST